MANSLKTPLKRARGLGSAKSGVQHWWYQRLTALVLIPLTLWAFFVLIQVPTLDAPTAGAFLAQPVHGIIVAILLMAMLWHAKLGLTVVVEDYVHCPAKKIVLLITVTILTVLGMAASGLAIAKLIILS